MSLITEQIKQLREHYKSCDLAGDYITRDMFKRAADTIEQLAAKVRKENGFIFPENPTNGDMIKALFPRDYVKIYDRSVSSWWNAPYKRGDTK